MKFFASCEEKQTGETASIGEPGKKIATASVGAGDVGSPNEFTLDDLRTDWSNYLQANRTQLEEAPFGLYGFVPSFLLSARKSPPSSLASFIACASNTGQHQGMEP